MKIKFLRAQIAETTVLTLLSLFGGLSSITATGAIATPVTQKITWANNPCQDDESWTWSNQDQVRNMGWIREFETSLQAKSSKIEGFSDGLSLRKQLGNSQDQAFSEYWISRMLFAAGLIHLSEKGFSALLLKEVDSTNAPFHFAAIGCLVAIHKSYPAISLDKKLLTNLINLRQILQKNRISASQYQPIFWEASFSIFIDHLSDQSEALSLLKESGPYYALSLASLQASKNNSFQTLKYLDSFFSLSKGSSNFNNFNDRAHLLYGRAAYSLGRYTEAIQHYQMIGTQSNERIFGLSETAWSYLLNENYREAIGIAIGLQSGAIRQTFAPEALMVMAMALNEMCRYPESMSAIQTFRHNYRDSYFWLNDQAKNDAKTKPNYYAKAVAFLKRTPQLQVPPAIASEWIRSSVFISHQDRINLLVRERALGKQLSLQGKTEQNSKTKLLLSAVRALKKKYSQLKLEGKNSTYSEATLKTESKVIENNFAHLRRLRSAAPIWRTLLSHDQKRADETRSTLVSNINQEFMRLNNRMIAQLNEISENNELIEVEILNGAGEDMIWQNAHPKFKELADKMKQSNTTLSSAKTWNWGTTTGRLEGRSEIWEDEVGSLSAELTDNCESKDKYLQVERDASF